jgi:hypothetical protein
MTFEQCITKLCEEAIACENEKEAIAVARRIQVLMHARTAELRGNLNNLPLLGEAAGGK